MRLLDTAFLVDVLRGREDARRIAEAMKVAGERGATTEVSAFELLLGVHRRGRVVADRLAAVETLLSRLDVLPLDRRGAARAADVLAKLRTQGEDIGILDALIAGIALASGYEVILTRDEAFRRVAGLRVETY